MTDAARKAWLITGCSSGLGRALALHALRRGDLVAASARKAEEIAELAEDFPATCRAFALDVADATQVTTVVAAARDAWGRLDVVVNNAGCGLMGALEEVGDEQIEQNFEVNFFGAVRVIRAVLPILRAQRSGHIVNISAAAAIANYPGFSVYGAAKRAIEGMSEALASELRPLGPRVTIVQPGPLRTDFAGRSIARAQRHIADYDATSGKFARLIETMNGRQTGDPAKAAAAIAAAVDSDAPPLRLVLGKYAREKARKVMESAAREIEAWECASAPVEFNTSNA